jgi:hypothetical protein
MEKPRMTRAYMDSKTKIQLADFLRQHCHANGDGSAVYDEKWSDRRVMCEFNKSPHDYAATLHHVSSVREDCVGLLVPDQTGKGRGFGVFLPMIQTLEARCDALETKIAVLEDLLIAKKRDAV